MFVVYAIINMPSFPYNLRNCIGVTSFLRDKKDGWRMRERPCCKIHFIPVAAPRLDTGVSRNGVKHYSTLHFTKVESTW